MTDMFTPQDEFDFAGDSTVESLTAVFTITDAVAESFESDKGQGVRHVLTFESDAVPFPITVRQIVAYEYKNGGGDTSWVKRSRGVMKNIVKAATGETSGSLSNLIGRQLQATTRDDGRGFYTLGKYRAVSQEAIA